MRNLNPIQTYSLIGRLLAGILALLTVTSFAAMTATADDPAVLKHDDTQLQRELADLRQEMEITLKQELAWSKFAARHSLDEQELAAYRLYDRYRNALWAIRGLEQRIDYELGDDSVAKHGALDRGSITYERLRGEIIRSSKAEIEQQQRVIEEVERAWNDSPYPAVYGTLKSLEEHQVTNPYTGQKTNAVELNILKYKRFDPEKQAFHQWVIDHPSEVGAILQTLPVGPTRDRMWDQYRGEDYRAVVNNLETLADFRFVTIADLGDGDFVVTSNIGPNPPPEGSSPGEVDPADPPPGTKLVNPGPDGFPTPDKPQTRRPGQGTGPDRTRPPNQPTTSGAGTHPSTPTEPATPGSTVAENLTLSIDGPSRAAANLPVRLRANVAGKQAKSQRLAVVWYSGNQEVARGFNCETKMPASGGLTFRVQCEVVTATGTSRVVASAEHQVKLEKIPSIKPEMRMTESVVPLGKKITAAAYVLAPGVPYSRLRYEWAHDRSSELTTSYTATTPGPVELRFAVYYRADNGEVKAAEVSHSLLVAAADVEAPKLMVQGQKYEATVKVHSAISSQVKQYGWGGASVLNPQSRAWNDLKPANAPNVAIMDPITSMVPAANAAAPRNIIVTLSDNQGKQLVRAEAPVERVAVGITGAATDVWEGGPNGDDFGLNRKRATNGERVIDGTPRSTASAWGVIRLSLDSATAEQQTQGVLSLAKEELKSSPGFDLKEFSIKPFNGYLIERTDVKYSRGGGSPLTGYRDASAIQDARGWLINGPTLLRVQFHGAASGLFDNSDEAWMTRQTSTIFQEASAIVEGLSFSPDPEFQSTKYAGPALDGSDDVPELKLRLDGPKGEVSVGQDVTITAVPVGGKPPYEYTWDGDHLGNGASVRTPAMRPSEHHVACMVTSKDGQKVSTSLTYTVGGAVGKLTGIPPVVRFGQSYRIGVVVPAGLKGARVYWQASPNVEFTDPESPLTGSTSSSTASTSVLIDRCPEEGLKLWAQLINKDGATIGEAEQVTVKVQAPTFIASVEPLTARVGERVVVKVTPSWTVADELMDFDWTDPDSAGRQGLSDNASEIVISRKDTSPLTMHADVHVPTAGDSLGEVRWEASDGFAAGLYDVIASARRAGPPAQIWKEGVGLVDVAKNTYVVDQRVLLSVDIVDYPNPERVRWKWTADPGTSLTSYDARFPTATRHESGTAQLKVTATDPNGIVLGSDSVQFVVVPQSAGPPGGTSGATETGSPPGTASGTGTASAETSPGEPDTGPTGPGSGSAGDSSLGSGPGSSGTSGLTPEQRAAQLTAVAAAQADRGAFESAVETLRQVRTLDPAQGFAVGADLLKKAKAAATEAENAWDFQRSGELFDAAARIVPGDVESLQGKNRAPVYAQRKTQVELWRTQLEEALNRRDFDAAEERLKSIRLWEDIMPNSPRPETEALASRYESDRAACEGEFKEFQKEVATDQTAWKVDEARRKLIDRLNQGGLTRDHRNWIDATLVAGEQLRNLPPPKVTPLQKPWAHVAQIDTLWTIDADGNSGLMGLSYYPDRLEGWVDFGGGQEPLAGMTYSEATSRISFIRSSTLWRFNGVANASRMQGKTSHVCDTGEVSSDRTWVARRKSTTVRGETGKPVDADTLASGWAHQAPPITATTPTVATAGAPGPASPIPAVTPPTVMQPKSPASASARAGVRILVSNEATIEKTRLPEATDGSPLLKAGQILTRVSGSWKAQEYREPAKEFGPFIVHTAGKLRVEIDTEPHAQHVWSLGNADTGLHVQYQQKRGSEWGPPVTIAKAAGLIIDNENKPLTGEGSWPGPGRLIILCSAPGGSGPLSGSQFGQSFKGVVEITEVQPLANAVSGATLQAGDRIRTGGNGGVVLAGPEARYRVGANSDITVESSDEDGRVRGFDVRSGSLRVSEEGQGPQPAKVNVQLPNGPTFTVTPEGTDYEVIHQGNTARVVVYSGSVNVAGPDGKPIPVAAGQALTLPAIEFAPFDASKDEGLGVGGLSAAEIPFDDSVPEPPGEVPLTLADGVPQNGWLWQDPGEDASITAVGSSVRVSVPDGNEFWDWTSTAPRLLHKVTGDFDLSGELLLESPGDHFAITEFMVYSPGSYIGEHSKQARDWLMVHYRLMGGGWARMENHNSLRLFQRPVGAGVSGPEKPVNVRMTRRGNVFRTYWSLDGNDWRLSSHAEMDVSPTIWPGFVFKRVAADGQRQEPAVSTLRNLMLKSGSDLDDSMWSSVMARGSVEREDDRLTVSLGPDESDHISVIATEMLEGDLDAVVRYEIPNWQHEGGQQRSVGIMISSLEDPESNGAYMSLYQHDSSNGPVARSDLMRDRQWRNYKAISLKTPLQQGWLRIVRREDRVATFFWDEGEWNPVGQSDVELPDAVWLMLNVSNDDRATGVAPLSATFTIERMLSGQDATNADDWMPAGVGVFAEVEPPRLKLPAGVEARMWKAPFALGRIFFDQQGNLYVFSSASDRARLVQMTPDGKTATVNRGDAFAGLNYKSAVFDGKDLLVTVDYWPEGGNRHAGVLRVRPDGSFHPITLPSNFGDAGDLIPAPNGGWYLAEFGHNNVFHLKPTQPSSPDAPEAMSAEEIIRTGERPEGMRDLVLDPHTKELLVLNRTGNWPYGGPSGIFSIRDGAISSWVAAPEGTTYESIDVTTRSVFDDGVFVLSSTGQLMRHSWEGFSVEALTGLDGFTQFRFSPDGSFYAVGGGDQTLLLKLWSPDGSALLASSSQPKPAAGNAPPPTMKPAPPAPATGFPTALIPGAAAGQQQLVLPQATPGVPVGRVLDPRPRLIGIWSKSAGTPEAVNLGIESPTGAVITRVQPGSPADLAGMQVGDLVVNFGNMEIENYEDLEAATLSSPVGSRQQVIVVRRLQRVQLQMQIGAGDPTRSPVVRFTHPTNAWSMLLPASWKVGQNLQREPSNNRMFRGVQSRDGNYLLYVYADAQPAPDTRTALTTFLQQSFPQLKGRRTGTLSLGGYPAAFVGASGGTEQRRVVAYRLAIVIDGRRYDIDAIAPPLSDPANLTQALTTLLNTVRSTQ